MAVKFGVPLSLVNQGLQVALNGYGEQFLGSGQGSVALNGQAVLGPFTAASGYRSLRLWLLATEHTGAVTGLLTVQVQQQEFSPPTNVTLFGQGGQPNISNQQAFTPNGFNTFTIRTQAQTAGTDGIGAAIIDIPVEGPGPWYIVLNANTVGRAAFDYTYALYGVSRDTGLAALFARQVCNFGDLSWTIQDPEFGVWSALVSDTAAHFTPLPLFSGVVDIAFRIITGATAPTSVAAMWISPEGDSTPLSIRPLVSTANANFQVRDTVKLPPRPCRLFYQGIAAAANDTNLGFTITQRGQRAT